MDCDLFVLQSVIFFKFMFYCSAVIVVICRIFFHVSFAIRADCFFFSF